MYLSHRVLKMISLNNLFPSAISEDYQGDDMGGGDFDSGNT